MALQSSRVTEVADAIVSVSTKLVELLADVNKVLLLNTASAISYTPATKTATIANATDIWTSTAHGLAVDQKVRLTNSGGALPAGFAKDTDYYVIAGNLAANTFQLSATKGGASVNATSDGTGTHTVNPVPDYITEETNGTSNISGRIYTRGEIANAVNALDQVRKLLTNQATTQGDYLGVLNVVSRAQG